MCIHEQRRQDMSHKNACIDNHVLTSYHAPTSPKVETGFVRSLLFGWRDFAIFTGFYSRRMQR